MANFKVAGFCAELSTSLDEQIGYMNEVDEKYLSISDIEGVPFSDVDLETLKKEIYPRIKKTGIEIASLITNIGLHSIDDEEAYQRDLDELAVIIRICDIMKVKYVSMYAPSINKESYENAFEEVARQMKGYAAAVNKTNVVLTLEHRQGTYCDRADRLMQILKEVNSQNLKAAFNPATFIKTKEVPMAAYRFLKDEIVIFYMRDMNSLFVTVPIGMGDAKIYEILRMASKNNFNGYVCLKSEMNEYLNRKNVYSKAFIPGFSVFSRRYRTFKSIDRVLKKTDGIDKSYLFEFQMRLLRKVVNKVISIKR